MHDHPQCFFTTDKTNLQI